VSGAELGAVSLRDDRAQLEAAFLPGVGMLCCSLRHRGEELLAQNAGVAAYVERGKTMGIPLLYPWANRLAGFDYTVGGRTVSIPHDTARVSLDGNGLPIHGLIGGRLAWEPTTAPGSGGAQSLTARLSWSEAQGELFEVFPFRHDLLYEARLAEGRFAEGQHGERRLAEERHGEARLAQGRLEIAVTVHACGEDTVPVAFGFHPYLSPPGAPREQWTIELPAMRSLTLDERQIPTGPGPTQPRQTFELAGREFDDGFDSVPEPARFVLATPDRRITLEFLGGYPCAQVYAPPPRSLICFEPMTAPANALRSGAGLRLLPAGESYRAVFAVSVE
jgi:aldose 1-epimerase